MAVFARNAEQETVSITSGTATSTAFDNRETAMVGIVIPAAFTGTSLTFTVSLTGSGTFQTLYDQYGAAITMTVAQGRSYTAPTELAPWPWIKLVSGSNEAATRTITLVRKS